MIYFISLGLILVFLFFDMVSYGRDYGRKLRGKLYFCLAFYLAMVASLRFETGQDWTSYSEYYADCLKLGFASTYEPGFVAVNLFFRRITPDYYVFQFIITLFCCSTVFLVIYRKSKNPFFILLVYFCFGYYFSVDQTITRQHLAIAFLCLGLHFIEKKKPLLWIVFVLLAFSFHSSAIIALPIYLTFRIKVNKFFALLVIAFALFLELYSANAIRNIIVSLSTSSFVPSQVRGLMIVYLRNEAHSSVTQYNSGLGAIAKYIFYSFLVLVSPIGDKKHNDLNALNVNFLLAILLFAAGRNFGVVTRLGYYYMICGGGIFAYNSIFGEKFRLIKKSRTTYTLSPGVFCTIFSGYLALVFAMSWNSTFVNSFLDYKNIIVR